MGKFILILEDTLARVDAMRPVLASLLPQCDVAVFDNVHDWVNWARQNLAEVILICLDHDLGPTRIQNGKRFDPGIGRDAADFLATLSPICAVVVHSTNAIAVPGMLRVLREAGWPCSSVMPNNDLRWIGKEWKDELQKLFENGWLQI